MECPLCIEWSSSVVPCWVCSYTTCTSCTKTYFSSRNDWSCMKCKSQLPVVYFILHFGRLWTTTLVEKCKSRVRLTELKSDVRKITGDLEYLRKTIQVQQKRLPNLEGPAHQVLRRCPLENCKGVVDRKSLKCRTCASSVCFRCETPISEAAPHACTLADVRSVETLRKETKLCPGCAVPIHKIGQGCDQMFCTRCRTAFRWSTGELDKSWIVLNPHAFRYNWYKLLALGWFLAYCFR